MQTNIHILMAQKTQQERRRISLRTVSDEAGVSYRTVRAIAHNELREYPTDVMERLCDYFGCSPGDLFVLAESA